MWAGSVSAKGNHPVVARLDDKSLMVFYPSTQAGREAIFIALLENLIAQMLKEAARIYIFLEILCMCHITHF